MSKIRVLVVDDSALLREMIHDSLSQTPDIEVVAAASDGVKALRKLETARPDVVTLDIQMPNMDCLETLKAIMAKNPLPVIMVSSLTQAGAKTTLDALDIGALDYVAKPDSAAAAQAVLAEELPRKIRAVSGANMRRMLNNRGGSDASSQKGAQKGPVAASSCSVDSLGDKLIAIGISTGGPPALSSLFRSLEPPTPPIVVVQHMPPNFTSAFADRLNTISKLTVKEAATGDRLEPNHVYVAPGGQHLHLSPLMRRAKIAIRDGDPVSGHKPSVDVMMSGGADIYGNRCIGVIMTGMGFDGADGCGAIRKAGGYVLGQGPGSSDVYGMNKVAYERGNINLQFELPEAAETLVNHMQRLWGRQPAAV